MNFLVAIKLSSDILQGSNIYKLEEIYTQIIFPSCCSYYNGYHFASRKGNSSY